MFPLSDLAVLTLAASAPFLAGTLTGVLRRRWSALALLVAAVIFYAVYVRQVAALDGPARGQAAPLLGVFFLIAWAFGELWGWGLRLLRRRVTVGCRAVLVLCLLPALALSIWSLQRQYIPETCLGGITVEMHGTPYRIDIEDDARLAWHPSGSAEGWLVYGTRQDQKDSLARLCRLSANGETAVEPDALSLGQPGTRVSTCREGARCITTDSAEFRLEQISLTEPKPPSAWFGEKTRDDIQWSGTVKDGWICFLPNGSFTWVNCQRWTTPAPGVRAVASADLDKGASPERVASDLEKVITDWLTRLSAED